MRFVWNVGRRTNPRRFPPGVHRYRSIEEMSRIQDQRETEWVEEMRRQRQKS
jgi:hypothetical protein